MTASIMNITIMMQAFLLITLSSLGLGASLPREIPLHGKIYTMGGGATIKGEIGGQYHENVGTLREFYHSFGKLYPHIDLNLTENGQLASRHEDASGLKARQNSLPDPCPCGGEFCIPIPGQGWARTRYDNAENPIQWLYNSGLQCCADAGPGFCQQLDCSTDASVWLCNDYTEKFCMACHLAAEMADKIAHNCYQLGDTGGQLFGYEGDESSAIRGHFNVVLNYDDCPGVGPPVRRDIDEIPNESPIQPKDIKLEERTQEAVERNQPWQSDMKPEFSSRDVELSLEQRQQTTPTANPNGGHFCWPVPGQGWNMANVDPAQVLVSILQRGGTGPCCVGPGPGTCNTVICQQGTAAAICNDNREGFCIDCWTIGFFVGSIINDCKNPKGIEWGTGGQVFADGGTWNVVLRSDNSCPWTKERRGIEEKSSLPNSVNLIDTVVPSGVEDTKIPLPTWGPGAFCIPVPGQPWNQITFDNALNNFSWLAQQEECCVQPGPGACIRVSCTRNTGVLLCNDNTYKYCIRCSEIAKAISNLAQTCMDEKTIMTGGQMFSNEGVNIVLYADDTCPKHKREADALPQADDFIAPRNVEVRQSPDDDLYPLCIPVAGQPWQKVKWSDARANIDWLSNPNINECADGHSCMRASCGNNVGVTFCNDGDETVCMWGPDMAVFASDVANSCLDNENMTGGQLFSHKDFNVIVHEDFSCPSDPAGTKREVNEGDLPSFIASEPAPEKRGYDMPDKPVLRSIDDFNIVPMTYKGEISGHYVELNGSIQEIHAQAQKLYPDIPDIQSLNSPAAREAFERSLVARQSNGHPPDFEGELCVPVPGQPWTDVEYDDAINAAFQLAQQINGQAMCCVYQPGPGTCSRVSCLSQTAILMCNDHTVQFCIPCSRVSEYASDIANNCIIPNTDPLIRQTGGQAFAHSNWNTVLARDWSC